MSRAVFSAWSVLHVSASCTPARGRRAPHLDIGVPFAALVRILNRERHDVCLPRQSRVSEIGYEAPSALLVRTPEASANGLILAWHVRGRGAVAIIVGPVDAVEGRVASAGYGRCEDGLSVNASKQAEGMHGSTA